MNHLPLNGDRLLNAAVSALATPKPSAARLLRSAIRGDELPDEEPFPDDAPDGTGAATKRYLPKPKATDPSGQRLSAVDPSQGYGGNHRPRPQDPLTAALLRAVNR